MKKYDLFAKSALTVILLLLLFSEAFGGWYDPAWSSRRPILIDNSANSNTLYDFQVKIDILYDLDMQPDFDDIRFCTVDSVTSIPYWMAECYQANRAVVYVKIPIIPGNDSTYIFMYYVNPNVKCESDGYEVFEYFDDFADADISDWLIKEGNWTGNNRFLEQLETANHRRILGPFRNLQASITEATMAYLSTYEYAGNHIFFATDSSANNGYYFGFDGLSGGGKGTCIARISGGATILISDSSINVIDYSYVRLRAMIVYDGAGNYAFHLKAPDSVQVYLSVHDTTYSSPFIIGSWVGAHMCIDDLRIRKYARPEPLYEIGEEQSQGIEEVHQPLNIFPTPTITLLSSHFSIPILIRLELPRNAHVSGNIYNLSGKKTTPFMKERSYKSGTYDISFSNNTLLCTSGIYFISFKVKDHNGLIHHMSKKIIFIRK